MGRCTGSDLNTMEAPTEVESEIVNVDDIEDGEKESCLVGRLITQKSVDTSDLIEAIKKMWNPKHGMCSRVLGESKLIPFCFDDVIDRDWVLKNQPWHFKGSLFAIKKLSGGDEQQLSSSVNVTVEYTSFWARLYDVPFSCMNETSLGLFAKQIGILESMDISGEDLFGKYIRFKVSLNITKPLLRGITVQVKGKHLWLPLKYESLPIFCFSCGIIGHDYNNCHSYDRNLKYSSLKLGEERKGTLPHDIIENILVRLPVKYLLRYRSVCKLWKATISDPSFAEAHLQQYKNSYTRCLLAWEMFDYYKGLSVVKILNDHFEYVSRIQHSRHPDGWHTSILCNYDGLYLKCFYTCDERKLYVLWNPSCRAYREIWCPLSIDDSTTHKTCYGIYYNPMVKDYEIVIADTKHYAVFSCRHNRWSDVKEINDLSCNKASNWQYGGSFNGSCYWLVGFGRVWGDSDFEIICFDGKFKKIPLPDFREEPEWLYLNHSGIHLCLFSKVNKENHRGCYEMIFWKKVRDSWMEFKVELEHHKAFRRTPPVCWLNETEVMLQIGEYKRNYMLYDQSKNTFEEIRRSRCSKHISPVIYQENLFLQ